MRVYHDHDITSYNTFGIAATAAVFLVIESLDDIPLAIKQYGNPTHIIGWWSNILITNSAIQWVTWHITYDTLKTHWKDGLSSAVYITAWAGMIWNDLVAYTLANNLWGIENLTSIPGSVWASPVQNIGAYGVELQDVFVDCLVFDLENHAFTTLAKDQCHFAYRHSVFKEHPMRYIVCEVTIACNRNGSPHVTYGIVANKLQEHIQQKQHITPTDVATVIENIRRSKLPNPKTLWNCGSFFQNPVVSIEKRNALLKDYPTMPFFIVDQDWNTVDSDWNNSETSSKWPMQVKIPAARLIEQSGLKWYKNTNVGTHTQQPLVIVNYGWATGQQIWDFSEKIIQVVNETFAIILTREVNTI